MEQAQVHYNFLSIYKTRLINKAFLSCRYNIRSEDEPVLRYVPYFGDDDTTGIDVSAYDKLPGDIEPEIRYMM
jgi:hypothetical protein